ncbi:MAG: monofunctional biosynthetic peptidoglycan transglycosylase [Candidatus Cryptobacteroides sp.]
MRKSKWSLLYKIPLALIALSVLWVLVLKWVPVWLTPLMISRSIEYRSDDRFRTQKRWRRIEHISPELAKAVIAGEDNRFFIHKGFDWEEIDNAIEEHRRGGRRRGASTISQQTAKNVFLLPSKTWVRKAFEAYFTVLIELIWGKERILEVYLNVAEMGLGIYGAEAAAKAHFGVTAAKLSRQQSCLLAACLPNPIARNASNPGPYTRSRASDISNLIPKLAFPEWLR